MKFHHVLNLIRSRSKTVNKDFADDIDTKIQYFFKLFLTGGHGAGASLLLLLLI